MKFTEKLVSFGCICFAMLCPYRTGQLRAGRRFCLDVLATEGSLYWPLGKVRLAEAVGRCEFSCSAIPDTSCIGIGHNLAGSSGNG